MDPSLAGNPDCDDFGEGKECVVEFEDASIYALPQDRQGTSVNVWIVDMDLLEHDPIVRGVCSATNVDGVNGERGRSPDLQPCAALASGSTDVNTGLGSAVVTVERILNNSADVAQRELRQLADKAYPPTLGGLFMDDVEREALREKTEADIAKAGEQCDYRRVLGLLEEYLRADKLERFPTRAEDLTKKYEIILKNINVLESAAGLILDKLEINATNLFDEVYRAAAIRRLKRADGVFVERYLEFYRAKERFPAENVAKAFGVEDMRDLILAIAARMGTEGQYQFVVKPWVRSAVLRIRATESVAKAAEAAMVDMGLEKCDFAAAIQSIRVKVAPERSCFELPAHFHGRLVSEGLLNKLRNIDRDGASVPAEALDCDPWGPKLY